MDGGAYQDGTEDYSNVITKFKSAGAEILTGVMIPPDMTNFWKQAQQQGWVPKLALVGKALLFPQSVDALGDIANGLLTELWWHRTFPWKSSLSGETCAQLADAFEAATNTQQTAPLLHYVVGEMAINALKTATDPTSKDAILQASSHGELQLHRGAHRLHGSSGDSHRHRQLGLPAWAGPQDQERLRQRPRSGPVARARWQV